MRLRLVILATTALISLLPALAFADDQPTTTPTNAATPVATNTPTPGGTTTTTAVPSAIQPDWCLQHPDACADHAADSAEDRAEFCTNHPEACAAGVEARHEDRQEDHKPEGPKRR